MNVRKRQRLFGGWQPTIRYHGNFCGPGWSDGKYGDSVCGYAPAVDQFDQTCKEHDCAYAKFGPHHEADHVFFRDNVGRGIKRTLAGIAVVSQGNKAKMPPVTPRKQITWRGGLPTPVSNNNTLAMFEALSDLESSSYMDTASTGSYMDTVSSVTSSDVNNLTSLRKMSVGRGRMIDSSFGGSFSRTPASDGIYETMSRMRSGVTEHRELIGSATGGDIVWFGHSNYDYVRMTYMSAAALAKMMAWKFGYQIDNWTENAPVAVQGVELTIRYNANSVTPIILSLTQIVGVTDTWTSVANRIRDILVEIYTTTVDAMLIDLAAVKNGIPLGRVRLTAMKIHYFSQSKLAVQNITAAQIGDGEIEDSDNVNAAMLTGRIYQFNGNYGRKIGLNRAPLDITATSYVTTVTGLDNPTNADAYSEPPSKSQFYGCKKMREINLLPGQIKTNQFSAVNTTTYNKIWRNYSTKNTTNYTHSYGFFHLFGFEKKVAITDGRPINVALNCDVKLAVVLEEVQNNVTNPFVAHVNITT